MRRSSRDISGEPEETQVRAEKLETEMNSSRTATNAAGGEVTPGVIAGQTAPIPEPASPSEPSPLGSGRYGKFVMVVGSEVIVDVNGNGERIPYDEAKHSSLKQGDRVEL